jgi:hypothetical protein
MEEELMLLLLPKLAHSSRLDGLLPIVAMDLRLFLLLFSEVSADALLADKDNDEDELPLLLLDNDDGLLERLQSPNDPRKVVLDVPMTPRD